MCVCTRMCVCVFASRGKQAGWLGFGPTNFHLLIVQSSSVIKGRAIPETGKKRLMILTAHNFFIIAL